MLRELAAANEEGNQEASAAISDRLIALASEHGMSADDLAATVGE